MAQVTGIPVTIYKRTQTGVDAFNAPVFTETPIVVDNVIVCPASMEDVTEGLQLYRKHAACQLCIPKEDTNDWEDITVEFFGQRWRTFGFVEQWIPHLVPGDWNRRVKVERYG